jgi:hypothetical protein
LIVVTWSIIASQLLRASCSVSLADNIQQHTACDAYCRQDNHNFLTATQPSQDSKGSWPCSQHFASFVFFYPLLDLASLLFHPLLSTPRSCKSSLSSTFIHS